jgi:hypothetical protein
MKSVRIAVGLLLLAAGIAPAQSVPPISKSREAAQRAVDATNAHTAAMTTLPADSAAQADSARKAGGRATQSAGGSTAVTPPAFEREVYRYDRAGRRDPFVSLMTSGELRPVITDLRVMGIVYDASGRSSVAILSDMSSKEQYRVRVGQSLGRIRVARIDPKSVTFTIEEFGFSRQETLALHDPNKEREQ